MADSWSMQTVQDKALLKVNRKVPKARDRQGVLAIAISLTFGSVFWVSAVLLEWRFKDTSVAAPLPDCVHTSYALCAAAYATSALLVVPKIVFDTDPVRLAVTSPARRSLAPDKTETHYRLHLTSLYISSLACGTYTLLSLDIPISHHDINSIIFLPIRWALYLATVPAIWWILAHGSHYSLRRKLYVQFLMIVTLVAGGIATVPTLRWGHKMYWMALACVPFPEICFHLWAMLTDAINTFDADTVIPRSLYFLRIYSLFSFQAFPAIYFAAFDGVLPLAASESIWSLSDWALKMVITSSLMEVNFMTIEQRRDWARQRQKDRARMRNILSLTSAIEAKDNFLATVSHELCTPLNGIIGLSYALQASQEVQTKTELSKTLSVVTMSGKRLLQLIYDVLDAAKMTDDTPVIKHESVNVRALVLDVAMVCSGIVRQGVDLRVQLQPVPRIIGDTGRIVQILHNLVGNSCKFTKAGHVLIGVRYDSALRAISLSVSDTGCGIPSEALHSVFDAFSQGLHRTSEGLGLGLHLVVEFVKAHHGLIEVESEVGKGSTFTVWLPVHPDKRLLRTALKHTDRVMQDLVGGTVVIRNSPDGSGVRSRLVLTSQPVEQRSTARSLRSAAASSSPHAPMAFVEDARGLGARSSPAGAKDAGASHNGVAVVPAAAPHEAHCLPSDTPPSALVTPGYHGEVHGVPLVFIVGSVQCYQLIDYLCAEGYMVEVQTSGERAVDRMLNSPLLPDAMIVFSAVHDTDGISFCLRMRQLYPLCAFPIIFLSPRVGLNVLREALNAGCMDVMLWPGVNQELMLRLRSQIAMHSNKRVALHRGGNTLRPYKLQLLPYFLRHQLAIATANESFLNEGNPAISYTYNHTAVMHLCIDSVWPPTAGQPKQGSLINEVHHTIHHLLQHAAVCAIPGSPDGWTFVADPDMSMQDVGINQFVAEVVMHMERLALKHSCTLNPRVGVAFGPVQMSVASATSEASFLALGAVITLAAAVAQAAPPGMIAFVQSDALKAVSPAMATVPMPITIAGGKQAQVQVQIMPPHNAHGHCFLGGQALQGLSGLHRVFASLEAARLAVHRNGTHLTTSRGSSPVPDSKPTVPPTLQPQTLAAGRSASPASSAASGGAAAPTASPRRLSQPALDAIKRATTRRTEANVPSHVLMHELSLSSVAQTADVRLPESLTGAAGPAVSVMAFLEAADMPLFMLPDVEGVRLLTCCKRAFTDVMLSALNQILAKPCVRE